MLLRSTSLSQDDAGCVQARVLEARRSCVFGGCFVELSLQAAHAFPQFTHLLVQVQRVCVCSNITSRNALECLRSPPLRETRGRALRSPDSLRSPLRAL